MLTAKDGDLDEAESLDAGADDHLTKPFSFPVLLARVHARLRRTTRGDPGPLRRKIDTASDCSLIETVRRRGLPPRGGVTTQARSRPIPGAGRRVDGPAAPGGTPCRGTAYDSPVSVAPGGRNLRRSAC